MRSNFRILFSSVCLAAFLLLVTFARAEEENLEPALLKVGNRPVMLVRSSFAGESPQERARAAEERIRSVIQRDVQGEFTIVRRKEGSVILLGDQVLVLITNEDVDATTGDTLDEMAARIQKTLQGALEEARAARDPKLIARGIGFSLVYTILFLALLYGTFVLDGRIERLVGAKRSAGGATRELILTLVRGLRRLLFWMFAILLTIFWLSTILKQFPGSRSSGEELWGALSQALGGLASAAVAAMPNTITALFIFGAVYLTLRAIDTTALAIAKGRLKLDALDADIVKPTATIVKSILILMGAIAAYPYLPGSSSDAFKGVSLMAGFIFSMGSSTIFGHIAAGFSLMFSRSFKRGDWIVVEGGVEGRVMHIGHLATRVQTFKEEINIPNMVLLGQATRNLSRSESNMSVPISVGISIGYATPWRQVYALLIEAANNTPGVMKDPPPVCHQLSLEDFYVAYELTVYIERDTVRRRLRSRLLENIQDSFNTAEVQIMSPHYEADPPQKQYVPMEKRPGPSNEER